MKSVNIVSVIIAGNIMNVLSAIVAEIMQILQNQIKQNVRTDSANESIHCKNSAVCGTQVQVRFLV